MSRLTILTLIAYYLPGYKWGGPTRSLANMVEQLGDEFDFKIITYDRDFGANAAYKDIVINDWNRRGKAEIYYIAPEDFNFVKLRFLLKQTNYSILYLNSFFHYAFTIKPLLLRKFAFIDQKPVVLAPRGEFSAGALLIKRLKKATYITLVKLSRLYQHIVWQASSDYEKQDIQGKFGARANIYIAPNIPVTVKRLNNGNTESRKIKGSLKIIFLSRISRKKNLVRALKILHDVNGIVDFNIYGSIEDRKYWRECEELIEKSPKTINVSYKGPIAPEQVANVLAEHDLFFLPTLGENFGHVILEALAVARPVLVSDQTPWRFLEQKKAGWDISLKENKKYISVVEKCINMTKEEHQIWCDGAYKAAAEMLNDKEVIEMNRFLFFKAAGIIEK